MSVQSVGRILICAVSMVIPACSGGGGSDAGMKTEQEAALEDPAENEALEPPHAKGEEFSKATADEDATPENIEQKTSEKPNE